MPTSLSTLTARVRYLVVLSFGSSVNAAAKASGVPQRTLSRIVKGETQTPNPAALSKFAAACKVSETWLRTGEGTGPRQRRTLSAGRGESEWFKLLEALGLDELRDRVISEIPASAWVTTELLEPRKVAPPEFETEEAADAFYKPAPHVASLLDSIYKAWTEYFRVLFALYGFEHLDKRLGRPYVLATLALGASPTAQQYILKTEWKNGLSVENVNAKETLALLTRYYDEKEEMMDHYERYHAEPEEPKQRRKPKKRG